MSSRHDSHRRTTLFGEGSLTRLDDELVALGVERAMLIASVGASKSNAAMAVREQLGKRLHGEFSSVRAHTPIADVVAALQIARESDVDCLVVLGYIERGETQHGEVMGHVVHQTLVDLELKYRKPVGIGIIGPGASLAQAENRKAGYARAAVRAAVSSWHALHD